MSRYLTRQRKRRVYTWNGKPTLIDRKLQFFYYDGFFMYAEGTSEASSIKLGQYILIEGDDDDNPFIAKLLKLYGSGPRERENKRAEVQWFARFSEVPSNKRKMLGRAPHPQEIFLYDVTNCDCEIDVETILGAVEVRHVEPQAPFPVEQSNGTLYVKLSWNGKAFRAVTAEQVGQGSGASLAPAPRGSLPTPDVAVMKRALAGAVSVGVPASSQAESHHSSSKYSQSKGLSARRQAKCSSTPGVRKKLQLSSPGKSAGARLTRDDVLEELLHTEIENQKSELTSKVLATPPRPLGITVRLSPIRSVAITSPAVRICPLQGAQDPAGSTRPDRNQESVKDTSGVSPLDGEVDKVRVSTRCSKTPCKKEDTPRKSAVRPQKKEEAKDNNVDTEQTAMTPRSKRKSAMLVSSRIRKQLNLLNGVQDAHSDVDDDEDEGFIPSKKDLESSSEEEAEADSEGDSIAEKKSRRAAGACTPRARRKASTPSRTPRKTPSKKIAPSTPRTPHNATPSIPSRSLPAKKPGNILEEARARLHVSSVPESLPCREQEFQDIYSFVESKVIDGTGGCMYISGVPGTGKTATVHEVMRCLLHAADQDEIPPFNFIEINGMKMTDPHQAYVQILQKLTDQKATADHAASLLEKRFSTPAPKRETTVLLVDELDLLWTRKQNVMYNLFDWPTRRHAKLVVLAIANTMDLPERIMINRVASRLGLTRLSFQPYTFKQLQQIITSRLNRVRAFEEDALQLVSRKVAALSGDARRCLDICRRATEICEFSNNRNSSSGLVGMSHVMEALDEMFSSPYITAIRCASLQEQLFLRAVIAEFRRLGLEEATFQQVFQQHRALCRVEGLQPVSLSEGLAACLRLGACRLLLLEPSRCDLLLRVRLNVSQDDVLYALKED
ncbi:origin recognition complex subunit 1 isoform X1 [Lepisosteus oculatus]|uniref:origin recognition complex subunit 1 isoform X1 n=1 Tax=Lepisosteus oculatus TaxID=7918 RepID=UPI003717AE77